MGRPGCSLCHPGLCFSHSVDGHLSTLPRERQWFLPAWVNTKQSNISHVSAEKRSIPGDFAYWNDVVLYIKSDSSSSEMEQQQVCLTSPGCSLASSEILLTVGVGCWQCGRLSISQWRRTTENLGAEEKKQAEEFVLKETGDLAPEGWKVQSINSPAGRANRVSKPTQVGEIRVNFG